MCSQFLVYFDKLDPSIIFLHQHPVADWKLINDSWCCLGGQIKVAVKWLVKGQILADPTLSSDFIQA